MHSNLNSWLHNRWRQTAQRTVLLRVEEYARKNVCFGHDMPCEVQIIGPTCVAMADPTQVRPRCPATAHKLFVARLLVSVPKKKTFSQSYSDCCVEACHEMHTLVRRFIFFTSVLRKPTLFFLRAGLLVQVVRLGRRLRRMIWALEQTSPPRQAQALTALQPHWPQVAAQRKLFRGVSQSSVRICGRACGS